MALMRTFGVLLFVCYALAAEATGRAQEELCHPRSQDEGYCTVANKTPYGLFSKCSFWESGGYENVPPDKIPAYSTDCFWTRDGAWSGMSGGSAWTLDADKGVVSIAFGFTSPTVGWNKTGVAFARDAKAGYDAADSNPMSVTLTDTPVAQKLAEASKKLVLTSAGEKCEFSVELQDA